MNDPVQRAELHARPLRGWVEWQDEEMLACVRDLAEAHCGRLTTGQYLAAYDRGRDVPSPRALRMRLGTWNDVLRAAGLPLNRPDHAHAYDRMRLTRERALDIVRSVATEVGHLPSLGEYRAFRDAHPETDLPCDASIRQCCGGWAKALADVVSGGNHS